MSSENITVVIMGKSGAGKDTVGVHLGQVGYQRIVTYTSRPMREGEVDGRDYHFLSQRKFEELREDGFFIESRDYNARFGKCSYGTSKDSLKPNGKQYIIITPEGFENILKTNYEGLAPVYLQASDDVLGIRLKARADKETDKEKRKTLIDEIDRRLAADRKDFEKIDKAVVLNSSEYGKVICINVDNLSPEEVLGEILESIEKL